LVWAVGITCLPVHEAAAEDVMPVPTFDTLMIPALRNCAEKVWVVRDLVTCIADDLGHSWASSKSSVPSQNKAKHATPDCIIPSLPLVMAGQCPS
jgi:hypothetical protein